MAEEVIEQVADQIEDVALQIEDVADATRRLTGREAGFFFAGAGIGVATGFAIGFRILEKRVDKKYNDICNKAVAEMREHYHQKIVANQPKPGVEQVERIVNEKGYTSEEAAAIDDVNQRVSAESEESEEAPAIPPIEGPAQSNVFESVTPDDHWDYAVETRRRSGDKPYVIHTDEYRQNESDYDQVEYTYFDEDGVVVDVRNNPVTNVEEVIGAENLERFGHGSANKYVVYVRNDRLGMDMEINKAEGSYAEVVQGHSLEHSAYRERRRRVNRRFDDD